MFYHCQLKLTVLNGGAPTTTTYTYNTANQLTSDGTTTYTYDPNGNLLTGSTWDRANRMLSFGGASHKYDGEGRRIQQTVGATITQYLLDMQPGLAVVLSETTGSNTTRYVHGPRGIHAQKDAANNWEHMLTDGLGSVRGAVDTNANVLWSANLDGYGNPFSTVGTAQTNYGFTGEYGLPGGLLHLRARNYNPGLGVFTALDPFEGMAGRPMSLNGYGWVEGNVANGVDPSGISHTIDYKQLISCQDAVSCPVGQSQEECICQQQCGTLTDPISGYLMTVNWELSTESCSRSCLSNLASQQQGGCKIEVAGLQVFNGLGYHAAIIFTDRDGRQYVFRSGVPLDGRPECRQKEGNVGDFFDVDGWFGIICAQGDPIDLSEDNELGDQSLHPRQLLLAGENACQKERCLYETVRRINQAGLVYDVLTRNSNSGAYTYLAQCGIPAVTPEYGSYTGWGNEYDLNEDVIRDFMPVG
jgi:RHS repeat-associated protein